MNTRFSNTFLILLVMLSLPSCSTLSKSSNDQGMSTTITPTRVVVRILDLSAASSALPSATSTPELPTPTPVILHTATPLPAHETSPAETQQPTPTTCLNQAEFVRNLSITDNTELKAGQVFTKIWRIKNSGTCTWSTDYALLFFSGDIMGGPSRANLPGIVAPGETVDIQINLTAPLERASYTGNWVLSDPNGNLFGLGQDGNQPLAVVIQVKPTPRPTPG